MTLDELIIETDEKTCEGVDDRSIIEWAEEHIYLTGEFSDCGIFRVNKSRYLIEPLLAIKDYHTECVVVLKAVKTGGTMLMDIAVPWFIANRSGPCQWTFPTNLEAEKHMKTRLIPIMKSCKGVAHLLPKDERKLTKEGIEFGHMTLYMNGATDAALQHKDIMIEICDEAWQFPVGRLQWAENRISAFRNKGNAKFIVISQAGIEGERLDELYKLGTQEEWTVPCVSCGKYFIPLWGTPQDKGGIKFNSNFKTEKGGYDLNKINETIHYECPHCLHQMKDSKKLKLMWNDTGKYEITNPDHVKGYRSFHWNSIIVYSWEKMVRDFLMAKEYRERTRDASELIKFRQSHLAQPAYDGYSEYEAIMVIDYDISNPMDKSACIFMTIDKQKDCFWVVIREWAENGDSRLLWFGKLVTDQELKAKQQEYTIPNNRVFMDISYEMKQSLAYCAMNGWMGLRGTDKANFVWTDKKTGSRYTELFSPRLTERTGIMDANGKEIQGFFFELSTNALKDYLWSLTTNKTQVQFLCPKNSEYIQQMQGERKKFKGVKDGRNRYIWEKKHMLSQNHAFDCEYMQVAVALMYRHKINLISNMFPTLASAMARDVVTSTPKLDINTSVQ